MSDERAFEAADVTWGIANAIDDRVICLGTGRRLRAEWIAHDVMRLRAMDDATVGDFRITVSRIDPAHDDV
jgi:hypothetical protein